MRVIYVLLSPTFGMHQYTADLANGMAEAGSWKLEAGRPGLRAADRMGRKVGTERSNAGDGVVTLVTTTTLPRDRYSPAVRIETPLTSRSTGFNREGLDIAGYRRVLNVRTFQRSNVPTLVHFTGVHAWNVPLVWALRRRGAAVVHTLHDLHPHGGVRHGRLIGLWNRLIIGSGAHILVHGRRFRDELLARGAPAERVTYAPLLHGFWGYEAGRKLEGGSWKLEAGGWRERDQRSIIGNRESAIRNCPLVLFFGRVEAYKGVEVLLAAWESLQGSLAGARLVIAGPVAQGVSLPALPRGVELRDRLIDDEEAVELFRGASLLVLPYRDATQSALIGVAYAFELPVIVTETGALPEYVAAGETGWVVPPGDHAALAAALGQALADPAHLRATGQAGRAWYNQLHREKEAALAAMIDEVLGRPP